MQCCRAASAWLSSSCRKLHASQNFLVPCVPQRELTQMTARTASAPSVGAEHCAGPCFEDRWFAPATCHQFSQGRITVHERAVRRSASPGSPAPPAPVLADSALVPPGPASHEPILLLRWDLTLFLSHAVVYLANCPTPTSHDFG